MKLNLPKIASVTIILLFLVFLVLLVSSLYQQLGRSFKLYVKYFDVRPELVLAEGIDEGPGSVVINELMWMGSSSKSRDEWLELRNTTGAEIDIGGWQLTKKKTNGDEDLMIEIPSGEKITANGFYLISEYDEAHSKIKVTPDLVSGNGDSDGPEFALANTKLEIKLYDGAWDSSGTLIDVADDGVGSPAAGDGGNHYSMERNDTPGDGAESSSWRTCEDLSSTVLYWDTGATERGTPRAQNSVCGVGATLSPTSIPTTILTPTVVPTSSPTPAPTSTPTTAPIPTPTPTATLSPTLTPATVNPGDVVINEIAWMGTSASASDEWIELYNNTGSELNLLGWSLRSADGSLESFLSGSISAGGYYLLERTNDGVIRNIEADFIYAGSLGNGGEHLRLIDSMGQVVDEVNCSEGWFAGDNEIKSSMERISPSEAGSNSANWDTNDGSFANGEDSGGDPILGTPRARNSVYGREKKAEFSEEPVIDFETPGAATAGESFEVGLSLENFDPNAEYQVKFLAGSDGEKFYDGKTLSNDEEKYLAWNAGWSGFPKFKTDATGAVEFDFEVLIKDTAEEGDYKVKVRIRNEETESSTDSEVKDLKVEMVENLDSSEDGDDTNAGDTLGIAVLTQLPVTGPSQDSFLLLGEVFLYLGFALKLFLFVV